MKKITGMLQQRQDKRHAANESATLNGSEKPEDVAARSVRLFCESGGPNNGVSVVPPLIGPCTDCGFRMRKSSTSLLLFPLQNRPP